MNIEPKIPVRIRVTHPEGGEVKTRQSDAMQTDVNAILARYIAHGTITRPPGTAQYGDFSTGLDYKAALDAITAAEAQFLELPAHIRSHVSNDPGEFLDMVHDPERSDELRELGLLPQQDPTIDPPPSEPLPAAPPDPAASAAGPVAGGE